MDPLSSNVSGSRFHHSVASSTVWTTVGFVLSQVFRAASNIILAALLFEEAFALMAIVLAIVQGLVMLSDIGIGPSIIQNKRGDDTRFLNTAWTIQILRAAVLTLIACCLAKPVAEFYATNDPYALELNGLILVIAIGTFVTGFYSTKIHSAYRHLNLASVAKIELGSQVVGITTTVMLAWQTGSVYSLAFGSITTNVMILILSHTALPGRRSKIDWDSSAAWEIIHFGKWILVSTMIAFLALQLDKLIFSKYFPLAVIGVYAIAANFAMLVPTFAGKLLSSVAFPSFSKIVEENGDINNAVAKAKSLLLACCGYLVAGFVGCGESFIETAYDDRYIEAGTFIVILSIGTWFAVLDGIYGSALLAHGKANWTALTNAVKVIAFCIFLLPGIHYWGILGAISAVAASDATKLLISLAGARSINLLSRRQDVIYTALWLTVVIITKGATEIVKSTWPISSFHLLLFQISVTTICFIPVFWRLKTNIHGTLYSKTSKPDK